jgi:thiaminase
MRLLVLALVAFCSEAADPRFSDELWNDIRPIYAQTLTQPFLTGIADGTLPRSHFQFYLTQDAKYLRVFGEVLSVRWSQPRFALRRNQDQAADTRSAFLNRSLRWTE